MRFGFIGLVGAALCALAGCGDDSASASGTTSSSPGGAGGEGASGGAGGQGTGGTGGTPLVGCELLQSELQAVLDQALVADTLPGVAAQVHDGECVFTGTAGFANLPARTPLASTDVFRVGSISKTFLAATMVQLDTEGLLSLDATVETYLPGLLPDGATITVRQLLNHTSGLFNYTDHPDFTADAIATPTKVWTPDELVAYATGEPLDFQPGTGWSYSNTGYIVAGMVAEVATGTSIAAEIRARVLEPAALEHTFFAGEEPNPPELIHGYADGPSGPVDATNALHVSAAWTAGAMMSTTADLTSFYRQLLAGEIVTAAELTQMTTWVDAGSAEYGLGLLHEVSALGDLTGHNGAIWGFQSSSLHDPAADRSFTVLINSSSDSADAILLDLADVVTAQP